MVFLSSKKSVYVLPQNPASSPWANNPLSGEDEWSVITVDFWHSIIALFYIMLTCRTGLQNIRLCLDWEHAHTYTKIRYIVNSMRTLKLYVLVEHFQNNGHEKAVCLLPVFLYGCHFVYGTLSSWNRKSILAFILLKCLSKETAWLSLAHVKCWSWNNQTCQF